MCLNMEDKHEIAAQNINSVAICQTLSATEYIEVCCVQ